MNPIKVLLVDDEVMVKRLLSDKVNWARFDMEIIGAVSSAREALAFINKFEVDLIITDIKMPLMDGNCLIEEALRIKKDIRFIVLSAYTDFGMVRKSFKLGVYDYLQKSEINTPAMNNVLMKLRNDIIDDRQEQNEPEFDSEVSTEIDEPTISECSLYTVICVAIRNGKLPTAALDVFRNNNNQFLQCHILRVSATDIMLLVRHRLSSMRQINCAIRDLLDEMKSFFDHDSDYLIGVSSTGIGSQVEYLKKESEKALADSYYAPVKMTVFYYIQTGITDDDKLNEQYWKDKLRKDLCCIDISAATATIHKLLLYIAMVKPPKEICQELVCEIYCFYISYLGTINIIKLEDIVDLRHTDISMIIMSFNRFTDLNDWIKANLDFIKNKYILEYKSNITEIIKAYVTQNLAEDLSLKKIARTFDISCTYISHLYKIREGISLNRYISNTRLLKAQDFLLNTNMMVKDICSLIGYNNFEHFSREFKNKFGLSPNQFRKEHRTDQA
ncbi:MAG: response regulator [Bacillota bacterium]|nr:response regulator [Bacillota bacterium]